MSEKLYGKVLATKLVAIPATHLKPDEKTPRFFIQVQPMNGRSEDKSKKPVAVDCLVQTEELNGTKIEVGMRINCTVEKGSKAYVLVSVDKIYDLPSKGYTRPNKNRGAEIGNSINVSTHLTGSFDPDVVKKCAEEILPVMQKIREDMAAQYKDMDEYARNMRLGQCFLLASQGRKSKGEVISHAWIESFERSVKKWFSVGCALENQDA